MAVVHLEPVGKWWAPVREDSLEQPGLVQPLHGASAWAGIMREDSHGMGVRKEHPHDHADAVVHRHRVRPQHAEDVVVRALHQQLDLVVGERHGSQELE